MVDPATETRGGNKLEIGDSNLHSEWDDVPSATTLRGHPSGGLVAFDLALTIA